ncbi:leucine-rich repeats and immunoglobulin-like domains protein 3 [Athalia rosae]|uniref:leucine-rich repeats and immunoglobulin-like domains protein 3 n=1 Tax=Athalia rosae TaxID=37344 RepID=UPI002034A156|nr:leucine-rich repeats and immunoglobulin-like domains protein 3 [Athalia rosae]
MSEPISHLLTVVAFWSVIVTVSVGPAEYRTVFQICVKNDEVIFVGATLTEGYSWIYSCDVSLLNSSVVDNLNGRALVLDDLKLAELKPGFLKIPRIGDLFLEKNKFEKISPELFSGIDMYQLHLAYNGIEIIREGSFANEYLTALRLNDNVIREIEPGAFSYLTKLTWLSLLRNKIASVSFANSLPPNITFLSIEYNLVNRIPEASFNKLEKLEYLGLDVNVIEEMAPGAFKGLESLTVLYLRYNRIRALKCGVFQGLINLVHLNLNNNEIESIEPESFEGLDKLEELELSSNRLGNAEPSPFKYLSHLKELEYSDNNLTIIDENTFGDLTGLKKLEATSNGLTVIKIGAFRRNIKLETLVLYLNNLTYLEAGAFFGLEKLTEINLNANQLSELNPGVFDDMTELRILHLGDNKIGYLRNGTFSNLKELNTLYIANNRISKIDIGTFTNYPRLLEGNGIEEISKEQLTGLPGLEYLWFKGMHKFPTKD